MTFCFVIEKTKHYEFVVLKSLDLKIKIIAGCIFTSLLM